MLNINCTTKELNTIILVVVNLNVINNCAVTNSTKCNTIKLISWEYFVSGIMNPDIF